MNKTPPLLAIVNIAAALLPMVRSDLCYRLDILEFQHCKVMKVLACKTALRRPRQDDQKFKITPGYIAS